jgi:hypothetical protein
MSEELITTLVKDSIMKSLSEKRPDYVDAIVEKALQGKDGKGWDAKPIFESIVDSLIVATAKDVVREAFEARKDEILTAVKKNVDERFEKLIETFLYNLKIELNTKY